MKYYLSLLAFFILLGGCASQSQLTTSEVANNQEPVRISKSLKDLKISALKFAEKDFRNSVEQNLFDEEEELTVQDHPFRLNGKTHPPLSIHRSNATLTQEELGKKKIQELGPIDLIYATDAAFLFIYRNKIFMGETVSEKESRFRVLKTNPLYLVSEEETARNGVTDPINWFESLVLDLDRAIQEGKRESAIELEIIKSLNH